MVCGKGPVSFLSVWLSILSNVIYWGDCPFLIVHSGALVEDLFIFCMSCNSFEKSFSLSGQKLFTCIFFYRILNIAFYIYLFSLFGTYFCLWCDVGISFSFYLHNHLSSTVYWTSFLIINTATLVIYPLPYCIHGSASGLFFPSSMCLSLPHCLHFYSFMTTLDI